MAVGGPKREVPGPLRKILSWDQALTKTIVDTAHSAVPSLNGSLRTYMKALELSCHGVPWFAFTFIAIYLLRSAESREVQINLLFGLVYDIMVIACIKAVARRSRPPQNRSDDFLSVTYGPDKFRSIFVALFFTQWAFPEMSFLFRLPILTWAGMVCASRVLMRRHYLLDVIGGIVIGHLEFLLSGMLWIGPGASKWLGDFLSYSGDELDV